MGIANLKQIPHRNLKVVFAMPEQITQQKSSLTGFLKQALNSVQAGIEEIHDKGVGVRLDADYCNSIVDALKGKAEFKDFSETELKMALKPLFKAVILNNVAKELQVIEQ